MTQSVQSEPRFVSYAVDGPVAWVMLDRAPYSNAQNYRLLNQLDDTFRQAVEDPAVKVIVLGGEGKHFSAGHDLGTRRRTATTNANASSCGTPTTACPAPKSNMRLSRTPTSDSVVAGRKFPSR